ncbi:MAG: GDP-mannose 4,6-dehydratase [Thermoguttaceae bacterium]
MKRAVIVGSSGQDGDILFERLRAQGHYVLGIDQGEIRCTEVADFHPVNILDAASVESLIAAVAPGEVYYLAAFHRSAEENAANDHVEFKQSFAIQVSGLLNFLAAIQQKSPTTRLFYAGSARIFGVPGQIPQHEDTPIDPDCVYGISKAAGMRCVRYYRRTHGLFAVSGILYNHESPRRPPRFVTQKIIRAVVAIKAGEQSRLLLGDLDAVVDWGYAPDYVDAMIRMLNLAEPNDFIIATGEPRSVRDFAEVAFAYAGLDWRQYVEVVPSLVSRQPRKLIGNPQRLKAATGWQPSVSFSEMIRLLLEAEERRRDIA